jgi:uncharacterized protein (DUF983 family)
MTNARRPPLRDAFLSFLLVRCPRCREGRLYARWLQMFPRCEFCGLPFHREPGYFVGALIFNYALSIAIVTGSFLVALVLPDFWPASFNLKLAAWCAFAAAVSLGLTRHSRSLWLALDYWIDPWTSP